MRIRKTFLQLTSQTYPYRTEQALRRFLPSEIEQDIYGNFRMTIGESETMFTCHLDTSCTKMQPVRHTFEGNIIKTDGKTILGADDKAGMTILLYMIQNKVPGHYYFFVGEEVGCVGSSHVASGLDFDQSIKRVISFDRRGTTNVITHQFFTRCCSDEFAEELSNQLNGANTGLKMKPDDSGILTDSASFMEIIPECTNISVGYQNEHTVRELQDIDHLTNLCRAVLSVDWEKLPTMRDPNKIEYGYGSYRYGSYCDDEFGLTPSTQTTMKREKDEDGYIVIEQVDRFTYVTLKDGTKKKMTLTKGRIKEEVELIKGLLEDWYGENNMYDTIDWNGHSLWLQNSSTGKYDHLGFRADFIYYLPELKNVRDTDVIWDSVPDVDEYEEIARQMFL